MRKQMFCSVFSSALLLINVGCELDSLTSSNGGVDEDSPTPSSDPTDWEGDDGAGLRMTASLDATSTTHADDVFGFYITIDDHDGVQLTEFVLLEEEPYPNGSGTHMFADEYWQVAPGTWWVTATPMTADYVPSAYCDATSDTVDVYEHGYTEVELVSQCEMPQTGGGDTVVLTNHEPQIENIELEDSKYVVQCETMTILVDAIDVDADPLIYVYEVTSAPADAMFSLSGHGSWAEFQAGTVGNYELTVTISDGMGGMTWQTFPAIVSADEGYGSGSCGCGS